MKVYLIPVLPPDKIDVPWSDEHESEIVYFQLS